MGFFLLAFPSPLPKKCSIFSMEFGVNVSVQVFMNEKKKKHRLDSVFISLWALSILVCFPSLEVNVFSFGPAENAEAPAHTHTPTHRN